MLNGLDLYRRLIGVQIRSQLQYRLGFMFDIFGTALITTLGFGSLALILKRFGNIAGWTLGEIALLFGIVETAFGMMDMLFSGFDPAYFGRQVRLGRFDQLLLRPVDITIQVLGSEFILRRIGRILQGAVILGIAIRLTNVSWTIAKILYLPVVLASVISFFGGLFIIGATISFWTIESIEFVNIFTYGGSEMMAYPMHIYRDWMRRFFTYVIPAIFLVYYPAMFILGKPDPLGLPPYAPFLAPIAGGGVLIIAQFFWHFGIRHYQSTGT